MVTHISRELIRLVLVLVCLQTGALASFARGHDAPQQSVSSRVIPTTTNPTGNGTTGSRTFTNTSFEQSDFHCYSNFDGYASASIGDDLMRGWFSSHSPHIETDCAGYVRADQHVIELHGANDTTSTAFDGAVYAELNAFERSFIYQKMCMKSGESFDFSFHHKAQTALRTDIAQFRFGVPSGLAATAQAADTYSRPVMYMRTTSGASNMTINAAHTLISFGGTNYNTPPGTTHPTSSNSGANGWGVYTGTHTMPATGWDGVFNLGFAAIDGDSDSGGNLIDGIEVGLTPLVDLGASRDNTADEQTTPSALHIRINGRVATGMKIALKVLAGDATPDTDYTIGTVSAGTFGTATKTHTAASNLWLITVPAGDYDGGVVPANDTGGLTVPISYSYDMAAESTEYVEFALSNPGVDGSTSDWAKGDPICDSSQKNDGVVYTITNVNPTATPTMTMTASRTFTPSNTSTPSATATATATSSNTMSPTATWTPSNTVSPTATSTPSNTASPTVTLTASNTATASPTATRTHTPSATQTPSDTATRTATFTASNTPTQTATRTATLTASNTATKTATRTPTETNTPSLTKTPTMTATETRTPSPVPTITLGGPPLMQRLVIPPLAGRLYTAADFDPAATSNSTLPISYSSEYPKVCTIVDGKVHLVSVGVCKVIASQPAGTTPYGTWLPTTVARSVASLGYPQTITTSANGQRFLYDGDFEVTAISSSGLPVLLESNTPLICTIKTGTVRVLRQGTCVIRASQRGGEIDGAFYAAAPDAFVRVVLNGATATIPATLTRTATPTEIPALIRKVAVGSSFVLGLLQNGALTTWGINDESQARVPGCCAARISDIAVGTNFALVIRDGRVFGWGANTRGQLDIPSTAFSRVTAIAAGYAHGLALKQDGSIVCWGNNDYNQCSNAPVGLRGAKAIAGGSDHSLAITKNGNVIGWGRNNFSQVKMPPAAVDIRSISAGCDHNLALTNDGTVIAWGGNMYRESVVPTNLTHIKEIGAGCHFSMALSEDGTVYGWGRNEYGQTTIPSGVTGAYGIGVGYVNAAISLRNGSVIILGANTNAIMGTRTPTP